VYKTGALGAIIGDNPIHDYYNYLMNEKCYPVHQARHAVSRRLAILSWGVLKSGKKFKAAGRKNVSNQQEVVTNL